MRILIVSDAWFPQVNGVVRTLSTTAEHLRGMGHEVEIVAPRDYRSVPCPTYPEIRLALCRPGTIVRRIARLEPDAVHIATEGPLGWAARRFCVRSGLRFTTSFHTKFPEYVHARTRIPVGLSYGALRRFHGPAAGVMVATASIRAELEARGFSNIKSWSRGVDANLFRPRQPLPLPYPRPYFLYVGRLAVEKNLHAFLGLDLPGTKLVIGDGPEEARLRARYPEAVFLGRRTGDDLARAVSTGDVMVFPSKTDTFGLVLLEALACGVPIAAFPVPGRLDVVADAPVGRLNWDLAKAAVEALSLSRDACRARALEFTWEAAARLFLDNLAPLGLNAPQPEHQR